MWLLFLYGFLALTTAVVLASLGVLAVGSVPPHGQSDLGADMEAQLESRTPGNRIPILDLVRYFLRLGSLSVLVM